MEEESGESAGNAHAEAVRAHARPRKAPLLASVSTESDCDSFSASQASTSAVSACVSFNESPAAARRSVSMMCGSHTASDSSLLALSDGCVETHEGKFAPISSSLSLGSSSSADRVRRSRSEIPERMVAKAEAEQEAVRPWPFDDFGIPYSAHIVTWMTAAAEEKADTSLGNSLAWVACYRGCTLQLVQNCVIRELQTNTDPLLLLREDSVFVRAISTCIELAGEDYLRVMLPRILQIVRRSKTSLEIDPAKEPDREKREENAEEIVDVVSRIMLKLWSSPKHAPIVLRAMLSILCQSTGVLQASDDVLEDTKERPRGFYRILSSAFFLRFLIPAIVDPSRHIKSIKPASLMPIRRKLVLVSKLVMCISNEMLPHGKEKFVGEVLGPLIRNNKPLHKFFEEIVDVNVYKCLRIFSARLKSKQELMQHCARIQEFYRESVEPCADAENMGAAKENLIVYGRMNVPASTSPFQERRKTGRPKREASAPPTCLAREPSDSDPDDDGLSRTR